MTAEIVPITEVPPASIKKLTDQEIGEDYYSLDELVLKIESSKVENQVSSFVLLDGSDVVGLRLSFPPGKWKQGKGAELSPQLWPHPIEQTAYFQSLFISQKWRGLGWGKKLSLKSIEVLKSLGALGIACHSWVESPNNSSRKYLESLNFKRLCQYPNYWKNVEYICPRCGKPCVCTAEEMYLNLVEV